MTDKFTRQVEAFARKVEKRFRAVARASVQETVSIAQRTVGEGGRMRVDTGFLRASIQASLDTMPSGPSINDGGHGGKNKYPIGTQAAGEPLSVTLLKWDPNKGTPLYVGWTANYARHREYKDGFLRGAAEQWDEIVAKAVKRARETIG